MVGGVDREFGIDDVSLVIEWYVLAARQVAYRLPHERSTLNELHGDYRQLLRILDTLKHKRWT